MKSNEKLFLTICSTLGNDIEFIQGAGGNVSVKNGDSLLIKASGTWLSLALTQNVLVDVSRNAVLKIIEQGSEDFSALAQNGLRPSIETPIHALLPQKYVFHVHHLNTIVHSVLADQSILCQKLAGFEYATVQYARPGMPLCNALQKAIAGKQAPVLILQNHGLVVAADTLADLTALLQNVAERLFLPMRHLPISDVARLCSVNDLDWTIPTTPTIHASALDANGLKLCDGLPLYPDHVVFLGPFMGILQEGETVKSCIARHNTQYGCEAKCVVVPNAGILVPNDLSAGALAMLDALGRISLRVPSGQELRRLSATDVNALGNWDAEKYRQTLDANKVEKA